MTDLRRISSCAASHLHPLTCMFALLAIIASAPSPRAGTPIHAWSQRFGGASTDNVSAIAVDGSGNVFITGFFIGTVSFGGANLVSSGGSIDAFVAKYNAAGVHQWSQQFGSTGADVGYGLAVDGSGNVYVTGNFAGTVNFGGSNLVSVGGTDIFHAKYNSAGAHQWSQRFGGPSNDIINAVASDATGNNVITGIFYDPISFGGAVLPSSGGDVFVANYNSAGVHQWSYGYGGNVTDAGEDVAIDGSGNVFVTGSFQNTADFGGTDLVSAGSGDAFLAKYNSAGAHQWSMGFGSTGVDAGYAVSPDGAGGVVVTGIFNLTVDFGGDDLVSAGGYDVFLARYDTGGTHQWSRRMGGTGHDQSYDVSVDGSGQVFTTGSFSGVADFGGDDLTSAGGDDVYFAKYSSGGIHQWSKRFGSTLGDVGRGVSFHPTGGALVTGTFSGTANFGGLDLVSAGGIDIFLARYGAEAEPVITSIVDVANDQGRRVEISFTRSGHDDAASPTPIVQYEAFRRTDPLPAPAAGVSPPVEAPGTRSIPGWAFVAAAPAHGDGAYQVLAPTLADSTIAQGPYYSTFLVRAATATPSMYFDSAPDSGYSLDNLAPGAPTSFAYSAGQLTWDESADEDFDYFSVYGSNTNSFVSATLIDYTVSPAMDVTASPYTFYFATTTDFSGNEGPPAMVNTLSGTGETPQSYVLSISSYPNPFNPATTIRYTVPSKGRVTITVYDARGAHVATLVDEDRNAGAYTRAWDGTGARGARVSSGVYFARVTHPSGTKSYKLVLLK